MGLFGKSKKNSSCCTFQVEEVKEDKKKKPAANSCCDIKIEEVKEDKKSSGSCCG